jgi:hypothetical protein
VITHLRELPPVPVQAVIINCGTRWVSTLELLSTLRHAGLPVLVIDCESADGSERHFQLLSRQAGIKFHWLAWPLRPHGMTLDRLFSEIAADTVLLVDSDVDIRDAGLVDDMCRHCVNMVMPTAPDSCSRVSGWAAAPAAAAHVLR